MDEMEIVCSCSVVFAMVGTVGAAILGKHTCVYSVCAVHIRTSTIRHPL